MPMRPAPYLCLAVLVLTGLACSLSGLVPGAGNGSSTLPASDSSGKFTAPNPLTVKVTLDDTSAASNVITPDGGEVDATGADGTYFALTIPKGALIQQEEIRLTPVRAMDGLPLTGGMLASVQIEPEGLFLLEPAALTIETPDSVDPSQLVGFGYHAQGTELHLYPFESSSATLTFPIFHFSGYGVGKGSKADLIQYQPTSAEDQMEHAWASKSKADKKDDKDSMQAWFDNIVLPALEKGRNDDGSLLVALRHLMSWYIGLTRWDLVASFPNQVTVASLLASEGLKNAVDRAHKRCVANKDPSQVLMMIRWHKLYSALLRLGLKLEDPGAFGKLLRCAQFDLEFDSPIHQDVLNISAAYPYNKVDATLHAEVHFTFKGDLDRFDGKATSESLTFTPSFSKASCAYSSNPSATKFRVVGFQLPWDLNLFLTEDNPQPRPMSITIDVGLPLEHVGIDCPGASARIGDVPVGFWEASFSALHIGEALPWSNAVGSVYSIPLTYKGAGGLFAEKVYPGTPTPVITDQFVDSDTTRLTVRHAPQP